MRPVSGWRCAISRIYETGRIGMGHPRTSFEAKPYTGVWIEPNQAP